MGVATIFRKNRLFCWIGSRVSNFVTLPFVVYAQVQVAHRIRTGQWADIDRKRILDQAIEFLADWCLGIVPVGGVLAAVFGGLAYLWARRRDRLRAEKESSAPREIAAPASVE